MKYDSVEIEDGVIPEGKELVRIGWPKRGEQWIDRVSEELCTAFPSTFDWPKGRGHAIIVRDKWEWPEWLKAEWICCNNCGEWRASLYEPIRDGEDGWKFDCRNMSLKLADLAKFTNYAWTPPPCTDWTKSKRRNPNAKDAT